MVQYDVKESNSVSVYSSNSNDANSFSVWHKGLDHLSDSVHKCISVQFPFIPIENNKIPCHICHFAKQRKMPFHNSSSQSTSIFELLHADIWGAYPIASVLGHKYFLTLVDDYSSFTWVILMKNKDETQPLIFLLTLKMFHFKVCFRPMNVLGQPWSCVSYPSSSEVVWMFGTYLLSLSNFQAWPMWYTWSSLLGDITRLSI